MHALIAALCIVLSYHICETGAVLDAITQAPTLTVIISLCEGTLKSLGLAEAHSNQSGLKSKIEVCRNLYAQAKQKA
jgi:hypothetical protein